TVAKDSTFYAFLHAPVLDNSQTTTTKRSTITQDTNSQGPNQEIPIIDDSGSIIIHDSNNAEDMNVCVVAIENFFHRIIEDIKSNSQLLGGIEYFKKGYEKAESLS
ncbi:11290_t:CDS:2, partial [Cetraspora pellucida]